MSERILIVDDEEDLLELLRYNLEQEGYSVDAASTGIDAIRMAENENPHLVCLDLMMPGIDGLQVCKQLRGSKTLGKVPIIMLTAKGEEDDIIEGLEAGADDYVVKPFSPKVLLARVAAVLRRKSSPVPEADETLRFGEVSLHPKRHEVRVGDDEVILTSAEFRALHHLVRHPGWVFTRQQLVEAIHGQDYVVTDRSVDVLLVGLRKKLGTQSEFIETVRGVGYRLKG